MTSLAESSPSLRDATTLFIGGAWRRAEETYERFDPARLDRSTGTFAAATTEDVEAAY
ncbi:MAG: aldehyde dehydrogenase family protein, partial [Solirubrobacterales bacterium]|nr:aldehyde dehydrogenase family protein [Solirubrobacterales bacterium]